MIGIYKIVNNINQKCYIGKSENIENRFKHHLNDLRKGCHYNKHLQRSFDRYGENNFTFELIEECSLNQLNDREIFWIAFYKRKFNLYNICKGGEGGRMPDEIIEANKIKISKANKGNPKLIRKGVLNGMYVRNHTLETRNRISKNKKGQQAWNKNIPCSDETKSKISISLTGRKLSSEVCENIRKGHLGLKYKRNVWTDEYCQYIKELHDSGLSFYKLGDMLHKNAETIRVMIRKYEKENK